MWISEKLGTNAFLTLGKVEKTRPSFQLNPLLQRVNMCRCVHEQKGHQLEFVYYFWSLLIVYVHLNGTRHDMQKLYHCLTRQVCC